MAIVRETDKHNNEMLLTISMAVVVVAIVVCGAILVAANANAKANTTAAMLERENRRTLEVQAAMQTRPAAQVSGTGVIRPLPSRAPMNRHEEEKRMAA